MIHASIVFHQDGFSTLLPLDGWGNARDVDKVWKASLQERADRVVQDPEGGICSLNACFLFWEEKDLITLLYYFVMD